MLLLHLALPATLHASPVDSTAALDSLRAHAFPLRIEAGILAGPGGRLLLNEARGSRFVMVGEDHGIAELPEFCTVLFRGLQPLGFHHAAIEVGPLSARTITDLARQPDPVEAFRRFDGAHPWCLPFVNWREEAAWVTAAIRLEHGRSDVLWGLDQEFLGSPSLHFERLRDLAPTAAARALADSCRVASHDADARAFAEHEVTHMWLLSANDAIFDRLARTFATSSSEARRIVSELRASHAVYAPLLAGDAYANNVSRTRLLKRHLGEFLRAARAAGETEPRVLLKFGAIHAMRGRTLVDTYDIGSTVHELAELDGGRAFNLFVVAKRGTQNAFRPFGSPPADTAAGVDPASSGLWTDAIARALGEDSGVWWVVDLEPLRHALSLRGAAGVSSQIQRLAWSFDAAVVIPDVHAAHLFGGTAVAPGPLSR